MSYGIPFTSPMEMSRPALPEAETLLSENLGKLPDHMRSPPTLSMLDTVSRYLGSLLSAYDLTHDPLMLERATDLGEWVLPAFSTKSGLVLANYRLGSHPAGEEAPLVTLAATGSLTLEFTRLWQLTGDRRFLEVVSHEAAALLMTLH